MTLVSQASPVAESEAQLLSPLLILATKSIVTRGLYPSG